jgi:flagellar hook-associated protein 3 FlgL
MDKEPAAIESQQPINVTGQTIQGAADAAPTTLTQIVGPPSMTTIPLTADNAVPPSYSIEIDGTTPANGNAGSVQLTFGAGTAVDNGTPTSVVGQINAATVTTGVTASWNVASQRLVLTSVAPNSPPFLISNIPSAVLGAGNPPVTTAGTTTSNFLQAFQIPNQVSVTSNLSTQIGDIDAVINQVLSARAGIGQQIQNLAGTTSQLQVLSNDNVTTQSTIADTNVAQATSQFTLTQTALQAAYATTSRLEGKTLIDYL